MPPAQDLLSDTEITTAYDDVRSDQSETTWLILKYADAKSDNLKLDCTGTGDIAEMAESLGEEAAYAYIRMKVGNDEYSERVKFAFVVWAGECFASFLLRSLPCMCRVYACCASDERSLPMLYDVC